MTNKQKCIHNVYIQNYDICKSKNKGCGKVFIPKQLENFLYIGFSCGDINPLNSEVLLCDECLKSQILHQRRKDNENL